LDLSGILHLIFGVKADYLLGMCFDLQTNTHKQYAEVNDYLTRIAHQINAHYQAKKRQASNKKQVKSSGILTTIRQAMYWTFKGMEWSHRLPYMLKQFMIWFMLPVIMAHVPQFMTLWIWMIMGGLLPNSQFGETMVEYAYYIINWSMLLLCNIRLYCLGFEQGEKLTAYETMSIAVTPKTIDWGRFLRGAMYVFIPMLMSQTLLFYYYAIEVNLLEWGLATLAAAVLYLIQTLAEEVEFRRPAVMSGQSTIQLIITVGLSSVLFGVAHLWNPEFTVVGDNIFGMLAMLSNYVIDGLSWAIVAHVSGGLEFTWGMHFANNFFLGTIVGYTPSPMPGLPLLLIDRGESSGYAAFYKSINSMQKLLQYLGVQMMEQINLWSKIYFIETLLARQVYAVPSLCAEATAAAAIAKKNQQAHTKANTEQTATDNKPQSTAGKYISQFSHMVQRYIGPFAETSMTSIV
jgi:membrane protease YdiL (CAAX protease family)